MTKDFLANCRDEYDVIVIGSGLAGLTAANTLAKAGHSVLLLEHHYQLGGMATWFKRRNGHIFDISLHGFPVGMIKSCRRYWTDEIAESIVQLRNIRFDNPMFVDEMGIADFLQEPHIAILKAVAALPNGAGKVNTLFNTHWHPEQTGSNAKLAAAGATILVAVMTIGVAVLLRFSRIREVV